MTDQPDEAAFSFRAKLAEIGETQETIRQVVCKNRTTISHYCTGRLPVPPAVQMLMEAYSRLGPGHRFQVRKIGERLLQARRRES